MVAQLRPHKMIQRNPSLPTRSHVYFHKKKKLTNHYYLFSQSLLKNLHPVTDPIMAVMKALGCGRLVPPNPSVDHLASKQSFGILPFPPPFGKWQSFVGLSSFFQKIQETTQNLYSEQFSVNWPKAILASVR